MYIKALPLSVFAQYIILGHGGNLHENLRFTHRSSSLHLINAHAFKSSTCR